MSFCRAVLTTEAGDRWCAYPEGHSDEAGHAPGDFCLSVCQFCGDSIRRDDVGQWYVLDPTLGGSLPWKCLNNPAVGQHYPEPETPGFHPASVPIRKEVTVPDQNTGPSWDQKLREPFPEDKVFSKPRLWCSSCRNSQTKVCDNHSRERCPRCGQNMTTAHVDLDYVGHADVTDRLIDVDPDWYWEPAHRHVDKDLMLAAIQTGNPQIVTALIANAPPLLDEYGGMWMYLTVHDDNGVEHHMLGYGDAEGKSGPNSRKELIGDGIRNAAMRRGVALDLWSKSDIAEGRAQSGSAGQEQPASGPKQDKKGSGKAKSESAVSDTNPQAQALADLAWQVTNEDVLKSQVYDVAQTKRWLNSRVHHPNGGAKVKLSEVIGDAKSALMQVAASKDGLPGVPTPTFQGPPS